MHAVNVAFWRRCKDIYPFWFNRQNSRVLEMGARNVGGPQVFCIRSVFSSKCEFIGVDWVDGDNVDVVSLAHKVAFDKPFDAVVSASMLEHDPYWRASIENMVSLMKPDGLLALSWGAARNYPHCARTAPDGKFHALPAGDVLDLLAVLGVYVHEFWYDCNLWPEIAAVRQRHIIKTNGVARLKRAGDGEVSLIAFQKRALAVGSQHIDPLFPEDKCRIT